MEDSRARERVRVKEERDGNLWGARGLDRVADADFLESAEVTGEVMNLDDFLKELQNNETPMRANPGATPQRISVFQSVGRAPQLKAPPLSSPPNSPPLVARLPPPEEQKPPIPQASVRPLQRQAAPVKPARRLVPATVVREQGPSVKEERMMEDEDDGRAESCSSREDGEDRRSFTSSTCLFSADDLRLATIPGQVNL